MEENSVVKSGTSGIENVRAIQEVQGAIIIARKFPRDEFEAYEKLMSACENPKLAELSDYAYPRGGTLVEGPSVHLARVAARCWKNLQYGIRELSQSDGESEMEAYAWDLEANVKESRVFTVKHERKAKGVIKQLDDPRDIYEMNANLGARRVRACILDLIPGDLIEAARTKCKETLEKGDGKSLKDRIKGMMDKFRDVGVSKEMIESRVGHKVDAIVMQEIVSLGKIFNSIKDGMSKREDWFGVPKAVVSEDSEKLTEKIKQPAAPTQPKTQPQPKQAAPTPPPEKSGDLIADAARKFDNTLDDDEIKKISEWHIAKGSDKSNLITDFEGVFNAFIAENS